MMSNLPCFLDFEASSLHPLSYPIEVAWSLSAGAIEVHLINPYAVREWTDWDPAAQAVHGLSREYLREHGEPPAAVAHRMNQQLAGRTVYCDAEIHDRFWCGRLMRAADFKRAFQIRDTERLWFAMVPPPQQSLGEVLLDMPPTVQAHEEKIARLKARARERVPGAHRAAWDVQYLIELYRLAREAK